MARSGLRCNNKLVILLGLGFFFLTAYVFLHSKKPDAKTRFDFKLELEETRLNWQKPNRHQQQNLKSQNDIEQERQQIKGVEDVKVNSGRRVNILQDDADIAREAGTSVDNDDVAYKNDNEKTSKKAIPTFIFEEHHEALSIWFSQWKKQKRTQPFSLIHIDGHSDMASFEADIRFPYKKKPEELNLQNIRLLATSNDIFIKAAQMAGIVGHNNWIFPSWLAPQNSSQVLLPSNYSIENTKELIGICSYNTSLRMCFCPKFINNTKCLIIGLNRKNVFSNLNESMKTWDGIGTNMINLTSTIWSFPKRLCYHKKGPFISLTRQEGLNEALDHHVYIRNISGIKASRPTSIDYILDIDEDFFGVDLPTRLLLKSNLTKNDIVELESRMQQGIFFAEGGKEERRNDALFVDIIQKAIETRSKKCGSNHIRDRRCYRSVWKALQKKNVVQGWLTVMKSLLKGKTKFQELTFLTWLKSLLLFLIFNFTDAQLRTTQRIGLCIYQSPETNRFSETRLSMRKRVRKLRLPAQFPMGLCLPGNKPWQSLVQEFVDTKAGIEARVQRLERYLKTLKKPPALITICRSSRDGYTPRHQQHFIEEKLLAALKRVFPLKKIEYHKNLFMGVQGWFQYKEKQLQTLLNDI